MGSASEGDRTLVGGRDVGGRRRGSGGVRAGGAVVSRGGWVQVSWEQCSGVLCCRSQVAGRRQAGDDKLLAEQGRGQARPHWPGAGPRWQGRPGRGRQARCTVHGARWSLARGHSSMLAGTGWRRHHHRGHLRPLLNRTRSVTQATTCSLDDVRLAVPCPADSHPIVHSSRHAA